MNSDTNELGTRVVLEEDDDDDELSPKDSGSENDPVQIFVGGLSPQVTEGSR